MIGMNKGFQIFLIWKFIIFVSIAFTLSGCPLTVNLNVSTDKPISLVIDKPIEVKLGADVAVTKLPPIKVK
jgi:metal-sulfur cluster biosynthetic enzyme